MHAKGIGTRGKIARRNFLWSLAAILDPFVAPRPLLSHCIVVLASLCRDACCQCGEARAAARHPCQLQLPTRSVGRSVGRSVVRLVIRKGGVSSARTVDRRARTQLPCQHVCTSSVAGRDVRPALDIFMFLLVNCVQIWTGVALGIFRRVSPNLTAKCPSLEMLYGRLAGLASPLRSSLFHTPGDGNGPFRWSHSPRSNSEVVGVNSIIIITAVIQFS